MAVANLAVMMRANAVLVIMSMMAFVMMAITIAHVDGMAVTVVAQKILSRSTFAQTVNVKIWVHVPR